MRLSKKQKSMSKELKKGKKKAAFMRLLIDDFEKRYDIEDLLKKFPLKKRARGSRRA